jgi:hypothetical protein
MGTSSERGAAVAVAVAGVVFAVFGAVSSCGSESTTEAYASGAAPLQYLDRINECRIAPSQREYCCLETVRPQSVSCPAGDAVQDEGVPETLTALCAPRAEELRIEWRETDQLGNDYQPCGIDVTEHRSCRCQAR